ncbi:hypothetical protein Alide_0060 [Alicycliphilus denitrificans BC]|nr:hypothetical protein Alide_0060 [Alicycliphilus denitrificans BC]
MAVPMSGPAATRHTVLQEKASNALCMGAISY